LCSEANTLCDSYGCFNIALLEGSFLAASEGNVNGGDFLAVSERDELGGAFLTAYEGNEFGGAFCIYVPQELAFSNNYFPLLYVYFYQNALMTDLMMKINVKFCYLDWRAIFAFFLDHGVPQELDLSPTVVALEFQVYDCC